MQIRFEHRHHDAGGGYDLGPSDDARAGPHAAHTNFDPRPRNWIFGRVTEATGAPVVGDAIDLWRSADGSHCSIDAGTNVPFPASPSFRIANFNH